LAKKTSLSIIFSGVSNGLLFFDFRLLKKDMMNSGKMLDFLFSGG
jgi:hypothetical protein